MTASPPLFAATALACRRGLRDVFAGLGFALEAGDALLLTGPNGSGKSSLLRVLAGLTPASAGAVLWSGVAIGRDDEAHCERFAYLGHADAVKPALSVAENLDFWIDLQRGRRSNQRPDRRPDSTPGQQPNQRGCRNGVGEARAAALARFGLTSLANLPARYLSAGQKRRLALARVVSSPRELWLLDEPGSGLDDASIDSFLKAVAAHRATGGIAVISTHAALAVPGARRLDLERFAVEPAA